MKISLVSLILFINTFKLIISQWRIVSQFEGTLPTGVYSFNVTPSDTIGASLNWNGSANIDLSLDLRDSSRSPPFPGRNIGGSSTSNKPEVIANFKPSYSN